VIARALILRCTASRCKSTSRVTPRYAAHGFATSLWERSAAECLADAFWLEKYLIQRGGRSKPTDIEAPKIEWSENPVEPVRPVLEALNTEKRLLEDLERLCCLASKCGNNSLTDMIETRFLRKESQHVKDLGDLLEQVVRVSKAPGHGLFHLDAELRRHNGCLPWAQSNDPNNIDLALSDVAKRVEHFHVGTHGTVGSRRPHGVGM